MSSRAAAIVFAALALGLKPDPPVYVHDWAHEHREVAPGRSPMPGKWDRNTVPELEEIQEVCSLCHPSKWVAILKSAQLGGTQVGVNLFGTIATKTPTGMLAVLPTVDEAKKYNHEKLQPEIDATPLLRDTIKPIVSRDEANSTTLRKVFPGGFLRITGANASAGLQMLSVRVLLLEEVSEFPDDVDGRGDPVEQAIARTTAYDDNKKIVWISTPGIKGACRITKQYEASDKRLRYLPCPHCGCYQVLRFENMRGNEKAPWNAHFVCVANGCVIEEVHKGWMRARGVWLKTYDGGEDNPPPPQWIAPDRIEAWRARRGKDSPANGLEPGFKFWQAYSSFVSWDTSWGEIKAAFATNENAKIKVKVQQVLGEAYEQTGEALDEVALAERRIDYPPRTLPKGALVVTAAIDVQDNRLEFGAWAWGPAGSWLIDTEVVLGRPDDAATWAKMNEVIARRYADCNGREWGIEQGAVDTGGHYTHHVYMWARTRANWIAIKGMPGALEAPIGVAKAVDIKHDGKRIPSGVLLYPVGQHYIKDAFHAALKKTLESAAIEGEMKHGAVRLPKWIGADYIQQLTAETLVRPERSSQRERWEKRPGRANEALDIRVYAEAAAHKLGVFLLTPEQWEQVAVSRGHAIETVQPDLFAPRLMTEPTPPPPQADRNAAAIARRLA